MECYRIVEAEFPTLTARQISLRAKTLPHPLSFALIMIDLAERDAASIDFAGRKSHTFALDQRLALIDAAARLVGDDSVGSVGAHVVRASLLISMRRFDEARRSLNKARRIANARSITAWDGELLNLGDRLRAETEGGRP